MKFDLPPLKALKAFETSARKLSFTKAAKELLRTPAAISFQVRRLETRLEVKLFIRSKSRKLSLTNEGKKLFKSVQEAFYILEDAKSSIILEKPINKITISLPMSFASKWFMPRLNNLKKIHPNIQLNIETTDKIINFNENDADLAIRYCKKLDIKQKENLFSKLLILDKIFPVCSPNILQDNYSNKEMLEQTLLADQMFDYTWSDWINDFGYNWLKHKNSPSKPTVNGYSFSHSNNLIDATIAGQGVALGRLALVADAIENNSLVRLTKVIVPANYSYYIVYPKQKTINKTMEQLIGWLTIEANKTSDFL